VKEYSLLDGANKISDVCKAAVKDKQRALAITDHGNMFGALEHYNECRKQNIKPIIGCEVYIAKVDHRSKHTKLNGYNHLTLLARNLEGYKNLLKLTSLSYIEGLSNRPRISHELLSRHAKGIICLSGCLSSRANELLLDNREVEAMQLVTDFQGMFGKEFFWLELQRNGLTIQEKATESMVRLSKKMGIPLVATNDIHYLRHEDCDFQDTMLCINTGATKDEPNRFRFDADTMYFKTTEEMIHTFKDLSHIVPETLKVAEAVDLVIPQGKFHFPRSGYENPEEALTGLTKQAIVKRALGSAYAARLERELQVIKDLGFAEYFLVVKDLVEYAKLNGIPVGPGRGSAAGCLVSFLLGVTNLDPIQHGLLFERFLNSSRKGLPDVDIDFCQERRKEIIEYLKNKYGDDKVASIITFNRFGPKKAVRQVARVLKVPLKESDTIAKKLVGETIEDSLSQDFSLVEDKRKHPKLFETAEQLEGYVEYVGVHASGIIISSVPIYEVVPMGRITRESGRDSTVVTQWDLEHCEKVGLVKFDILGLETLTVIKRIEDLIKQRHNIDITINDIPLDEKEVYDLLCNGDTEGVFQCYSDGMRRLLADMQPTRFDDVVAAIALFRPGPLESGIAKSFIARKNGLEEVSYLHPDLEEIMQTTYGVMVYQEQIMRLASTLGGFTLNEADELRKAVGKKLPEELAKIKDRFIKGCATVGKITDVMANEIWDQIEKFGRYGFNLSHSASYAYLTYYTAYLKVNYPVEFFCANLTQEVDDTDKLKAYISDAKKHGISVLPPCVLKGESQFTVVDNKTIRIGLSAIKGIGNQFLNSFKEKPSTLYDFALHYFETIDRGVFQSLAKSGAFDCYAIGSRAAVVEGAADMLKIVGNVLHPKVLKTKKKKQEEDPVDKFNEYILANDVDSMDVLLFYEREAFDFYLSGHPMEKSRGDALIAGARTIANLTKEKEDIDGLKVIGIVTSLDIKGVKSGPNKGKKYARMIVEDDTGQIVVSLFTSTYDKYIALCKESKENAVPISVFGMLDCSGDTPQVKVRAIKYLSQEMLGLSELKLQVSNADVSKIPEIKRIALRYSGDKPLSFVVRTEGHSVLIRTPVAVSICDDFIKEIRTIL
jgi:DNA polymerase-3 subunit alpha